MDFVSSSTAMENVVLVLKYLVNGEVGFGSQSELGKSRHCSRVRLHGNQIDEHFVGKPLGILGIYSGFEITSTQMQEKKTQRTFHSDVGVNTVQAESRDVLPVLAEIVDLFRDHVLQPRIRSFSARTKSSASDISSFVLSSGWTSASVVVSSPS
jgi:hypothetical protein